jgi:hypothetical protein
MPELRAREFDAGRLAARASPRAARPAAGRSAAPSRSRWRHPSCADLLRRSRARLDEYHSALPVRFEPLERSISASILTRELLPRDALSPPPAPRAVAERYGTDVALSCVVAKGDGYRCALTLGASAAPHTVVVSKRAIGTNPTSRASSAGSNVGSNASANPMIALGMLRTRFANAGS